MIYRLRKEGDPVLRQKCFKVSQFDNSVRNLANQMLSIMVKEDGFGISAPQVGVSKRIIIVGHTVLVNPEILEREGEQEQLEGCLSFYGLYRKVKRTLSVKVKYQDITGAFQENIFTELFAIGVQHEMDHLDGILFIDYPEVEHESLGKI